MVGIDNAVKIFVRKEEYGEVESVMSKSLLEFTEWLGRAKDRGAKIIQNGMRSVIVITENRYFVAQV